jgi:ATP-dependent 26S proteasome regulatory subunit
MKLPVQLDVQATQEQQLELIQKAIKHLEILFTKIKPLPPLHARIADTLFYNVISTKIVPKTISYGVGPVLALAWASYNATQFNRAVKYHPHLKFWKDYKKVQHDTEITYAKKPNVIEKMMGLEESKEVKITPCHERYADNICNGVKSHKTKQVKIENNNQFLAAAQQLNIFNVSDKYEDRKVRWAYGCNDHDEYCYHYRGWNSIEKIAFHGAWALRPLAAIPACKLLGQFLEDIQLPKYEARLKEKQKREQEKKVQAEMHQLKINYEQHIGFAQIKGQKDLIDREMKMIVDYLKNPLRYKNSARGTRSILLYGPPGTGKTLLARAIAKESGAPFLEITADDILHDNAKEKIVATMRLAEDVASKRTEKSAIIYIDEIDCVTGNRQDGTLDPQRAKALSNLLAIFDGIEKRNPFIHIVIIITTNHYKNLDPALLRPGRIDRKILITQPNADGRREFFDSLLPDEHKYLMDWLVQETDNYSGAQIVNIIDTAQMIASYAGHSKPSEDDYKAALQNCKAEYSAVPKSAKVS